MDALGWDTAHIVGNSLGGWVAFELERRGRARTLTGIAPAGGWTPASPPRSTRSWSSSCRLPVWLCTLGARPACPEAAVRRQLASLPVSATADGLSDEDWLDIIDDVTHCPPTTSCWSSR